MTHTNVTYDQTNEEQKLTLSRATKKREEEEVNKCVVNQASVLPAYHLSLEVRSQILAYLRSFCYLQTPTLKPRDPGWGLSFARAGLELLDLPPPRH